MFSETDCLAAIDKVCALEVASHIVSLLLEGFAQTLKQGSGDQL